MFPPDLTSVMTGASVYQLARWRQSGLLVPEASQRPVLYSFRDLVALRTVVCLRTETSLQMVRRAFANLPELSLTEHPSSYKFGTDGKSIGVMVDDDGTIIDLVKNPGQYKLVTLADIFAPFTTIRERKVVDFRRPRRNLEVHAGRLGGWPTIAGTRVAYDVVADLVADGSISADKVRYYYPSVSPDSVRDAVSFAEQVAGVSGRSA